MSINVQCPGCGKRYKVDDRFAGKRAKCQSCGGAIAVPGATKPAASDDPFAAMDELEQTGTTVPEPARVSAAPPAAASAPRRAGTVYNPALAQPTVMPARSSGPSQGVKVALSVGVGLVCFVLGFWAVHLLTGGASHKTSTASTSGQPVANSSSSSPGATDDRSIEATGAVDIANDLSGGKARQAPPPPARSTPAAPPTPADVDVEAKPPAVLKPFAPDPKLLERLDKEDWLNSVPYVWRYPAGYEQRGTNVFQELSPTLKGYQSYYVKSGFTGPPGDVPTISVLSQHRQNKKFPKVFTQATSDTKYSVGPKDPLDKLLVLEGYKVEFGTIDGIEAIRATGKDSVNHDSVVYVLLDDNWFIRIDLSNAAPGSAELALLDTMVRTLHYKDPKQH